jgi:hypothetical protein
MEMFEKSQDSKDTSEQKVIHGLFPRYWKFDLSILPKDKGVSAA